MRKPKAKGRNGACAQCSARIVWLLLADGTEHACNSGDESSEHITPDSEGHIVGVSESSEIIRGEPDFRHHGSVRVRHSHAMTCGKEGDEL